MVYAIISISILGFIVMFHHMYSTGMDRDSKIYFNGSTIIIGIPTGIKIYSWIISMYNRYIYIDINILYVIGFLILFIIGGITGIICSSAIIDISIHDTYYIVAHFHYVLSMGVVLSIILGIYYWIDRIFGIIWYIRYINIISRIQYYLFIIGVNILFLPMHLIGIGGMARRYKDYNINYTGWNNIITYGSILSIISVIILLYIIEYKINRCINKYYYILLIYKEYIYYYYYNINTISIEYNIIKYISLDKLHIPFYYHHYREIPICSS